MTLGTTDAHAAKKCPNCGLFNPFTAEVCDCGYEFATGSTVPSSRTKHTGPSAGLLFLGGVLFGVAGAGLMLLFMFVRGMGFSAVPNWSIWSAGCGSLLGAGALFVLAARTRTTAGASIWFAAISYLLATVTAGFALWGGLMQFLDTRPRY
jgi:hypothetical protein